MIRKLVAIAIACIGVQASAVTLDPDWSVGIGTPLEFCRWDGNCSNFTGVTTALSADFFSTEILGHKWHMLSVGGVALGMNDATGNRFLAAGVLLATLEKAAGLVIGCDLFSNIGGTNSGLILGPKHMSLSNWFGMLTYSVNFAFGPYSPPVGIEQGAAGLRKANTIYISL